MRLRTIVLLAQSVTIPLLLCYVGNLVGWNNLVPLVWYFWLLYILLGVHYLLGLTLAIGGVVSGTLGGKG